MLILIFLSILILLFSVNPDLSIPVLLPGDSGIYSFGILAALFASLTCWATAGFVNMGILLEPYPLT